MKPVLWIVTPCYNEEKVLPVTSGLFLNQLKELIAKEKISEKSRVLFVNDGSKDKTWEIISSLSKVDEHYIGIAQSRNRGHQNALLAGMMEAQDRCDIVITIDCDGQDDIRVMEDMVDEYLDGCEIVYGVRKSRKKDSFFKRSTAQIYYKLLDKMGVEIVYNHADYRLVSNRVIRELEKFPEVNLFFRGLVPLVGFKSTAVYYDREERMAGETHYPLRKMCSLAYDGITSFSVKPLQIIVELGLFIAFLSFIGVIWSIVMACLGRTVAGWASMVCISSFIGGIQLICLGVLGSYVGKIYMEVKHRPRYIISERTEDE